MNYKNVSPAVYVGTYKKYNNGSLFGRWMNLEDYDSFEDFVDACRELHKDEDDPEFMCQDYEGLPKSQYCESGLEWLKKYFDLMDMDEDDQNKVLEYWDEVYDGADPQTILDSYYCESMSDYDFGYMLSHELQEIPDWLECYIDYEKMGHEYKWDYYETDNYIFQQG